MVFSEPAAQNLAVDDCSARVDASGQFPRRTGSGRRPPLAETGDYVRRRGYGRGALAAQERLRERMLRLCLRRQMLRRRGRNGRRTEVIAPRVGTLAVLRQSLHYRNHRNRTANQ